MGTNFHLAPPAKTVDGLLAVPIDIDAIDAVVTFDGAAQTGAASATITYTVGPTAGKGLDHRQSVKNATISITSARHGVIPVENARPRAGGSGRSVLGASASRAARSRRRRRWATPRKEIVS
jgi:hypothetical protein